LRCEQETTEIGFGSAKHLNLIPSALILVPYVFEFLEAIHLKTHKLSFVRSLTKPGMSVA